MTNESILKLPTIHKIINKKHDNKIADVKEIMEFLTSVIRGDITEYKELGNGDIITKSASISDRLKSAELLGKVYSMYVERVSIEDEENPFSQLSVEELKMYLEDNIIPTLIEDKEEEKVQQLSIFNGGKK